MNTRRRPRTALEFTRPDRDLHDVGPRHEDVVGVTGQHPDPDAVERDHLTVEERRAGEVVVVQDDLNRAPLLELPQLTPGGIGSSNCCPVMTNPLLFHISSLFLFL
jgi:hypothetical protein